MAPPFKYNEPTKLVALRMPDSLLEKIKKTSKRNKTNFSEEVVRLLHSVSKYL